MNRVLFAAICLVIMTVFVLVETNSDVKKLHKTELAKQDNKVIR